MMVTSLSCCLVSWSALLTIAAAVGVSAATLCLTEREALLADAGDADIALSVAQYTSTQAEIHAAFPDDWVSTASAADASSVLVSLELSVHLVEQVDSDLMSDKLDWTGSPGWSLSYAVDEMPWAGVAVVQASLESEVDSHLLLEDPRLLSMGFPQAISHICIMGAEMSLDEGPSLKVFVNNYLICDFDVIATGIFADANGGVGVYGRSSGHAPIVSFQVQLRCGEQVSSSTALGEDSSLPAGLASTAGMEVISSKQTGIIAGVALNDSSTIQSWMGVAPIIATSIFQGSGNESCVDSLQISRMELAASAGQALKVGILPVSTLSEATDPALYSSAVGSILLVNNTILACNPAKEAADDILVGIRVDFQVDVNASLLISSLVIDFSESFSSDGFGINGVFLSHNDTCTEGAICSPSLSCDESGRFVHIDLEHNVTHASLFQPEQVSAAAPLCDSSLESEQLVSLNPPLHIPPTNCIPYHMKNSSISWGIVLSFKFIGNDAQGTVDLASAKASLRGVMGEVNNLSTAQTSTRFSITNPQSPENSLSSSERIAIAFAVVLVALFVIVMGLYFVRRHRRYRNLAPRNSKTSAITEHSQLTKCHTRDERDNLGIDMQVLAEQTKTAGDPGFNRQEGNQQHHHDDDDDDDDGLQLLTSSKEGGGG